MLTEGAVNRKEKRCQAALLAVFYEVIVSWLLVIFDDSVALVNM